MVITIHTSLTVNGLSTLLSYVSGYGQMGVQLFFVASAYTLCYSHVRRANEQHPLRSFLLRRFFRIAPLYYLAIIGYFLSNPYLHILDIIKRPSSDYNFGSVIANILFIHSFVPTGSNNIVPGGWSIGTEMAFYAVFPILFAGCSWVYQRWGIVSLYGLVGCSILINAIVQLGIWYFFSVVIANNQFVYCNLINQLPVFLLGILLFFHHKHEIRFRLSIPAQIFIFAVITTIVTVAIQSKNNWMFAFIPVCSGISFMFLLNIFRELDYSNVLLEKTGQVSYSMYIFHFVFAWWLFPGIKLAIGNNITPEISLIGGIVSVTWLTFLVAKLSHKYFEIPGIQLGKMLIARLESPNPK